MHDAVIQFIEKKAQELEIPEPIVEFGSLQVPGQEGYSDMRRFFAGKEYVGSDMRPGLGVDLVDDMEMSHFAPSSVGTVLCLETLEHVRHPWIAMQEAYRVLKPGGLLLVSAPFRFPVHDYPGDYWRMTAEGLKILIEQAGFEEVETWDSGEEIEQSLLYPLTSFGAARKTGVPGRLTGFGRGHYFEGADAYRHSPTMRPKVVTEQGAPRSTVPIVVPLFGREDVARQMFEQLELVTSDYSLVLVDNGFDDSDLIGELDPGVLIRNDTNVGAIKAINQGLERCDSEYVAVMHADAVVFEEGWLDHVVDFMDRRPDVGLVGLAGWHTLREDGSLDFESVVMKEDLLPRSFKPTWRFTEVAVVDGFVFVMRNVGPLLDESLGIMHYYDYDLSMQFVEAGDRIYNASIDCRHLAGYGAVSSRTSKSYLAAVGGDDEEYQEQVRERFRRKWQHLLPITRGFREEAYAEKRINELQEDSATFRAAFETAFGRLEEMNAEVEARGVEIEAATGYVASLERHIEEITEYARTLEAKAQGSAGCENVAPAAPPKGLAARAMYFLATEGVKRTASRGASFLKRRLVKR